MSTLGGASDVLRRGLANLDPDAVMEVVATLDLRSTTKMSPAVGMPLRELQQRRDPGAFAAGAPLAAVRALLEVLVTANLERIVDLLGDHAQDPTFDQLSRAVDTLRASDVPDRDVAALLAFAIGEQFPAAAHCRRILEDTPAFALPDIVVPERAGTLLTPKSVDPVVREARRLRREAAKMKKKAPSPSKPVRRARVDRSTPLEPQRVGTIDLTPGGRRRAIVTPAEARVVDVEHPRSGTVVITEIPFSAIDPEIPEVRTKERPVVIVAASESAWLVRGIYSNPSSNRQLFSPWRRLGLDHVSYISDDRQIVTTPAAPVTEVGRLTDSEWNSLW